MPKSKKPYNTWRENWVSVSIDKDLMDKVKRLIEEHPEYFIPRRIKTKADFVLEALIQYICNVQNDLKIDVFKIQIKKSELEKP